MKSWEEMMDSPTPRPQERRITVEIKVKCEALPQNEPQSNDPPSIANSFQTMWAVRERALREQIAEEKAFDEALRANL